MAAFDDRCAIVQRGGGRLATFPYPEMTVIHYNSRNRDGELMVLTQTPSPSVTRCRCRSRCTTKRCTTKRCRSSTRYAVGKLTSGLPAARTGP